MTTGRTAKKGNIAGITWMYGGGGPHEGAEQPDRIKESGFEEDKEGRTMRGPGQQTRGRKKQNRRRIAARTQAVGGRAEEEGQNRLGC